MAEPADQRLAGLLEAAPDAMMCVTQDGRLVLVNTQAERLFGYARADLLGELVEILVPVGKRGIHAGHRATYLADPRPRPMGLGMQLAGRRRDGSTFPAEISLSAIDTDQGTLVIAAVRDITERLEYQALQERLRNQAERDRLEQRLRQSERLESLGQLAGGVAHDFNNLLGAITNYAAFVAEEVATEAGQPRWKSVLGDVEQIQLAAQRATELTRQLLAFARREVVQLQVVSLNEVITGVQQLLVRTLGEHIELSTVLADDLHPVLADPGQIEQVLVNLAVNARDAMPAGGKLTIETANTLVDEAYAEGRADLSPGWYARMRISDTGTGMPQEIIDRAFEPFFTTKPNGQGTGLGLATAYGIITQAGGTLRIYSEPGLGTTLNALLPVTDQVRRDLSVPAQPAGGNGQTVLVVEDAAAMREVTSRLLARNGFKVLVAGDGPAALALLASQPGGIDVLLTDVIMPHMPGREVADQVRARQPGVRVLFMSGYTQGMLSTQGVLEPGVHLLEKPFTETVLLTKLNEVLGRPPP
jgi:PAS domain S-box-containing protein